MNKNTIKFIVFVFLLILTINFVYGQGRRFKEFLNAKPKIGENAPAFKGVDEQGKKVTLVDFRGKKHLVIVFGAIT